MHLSKVFGSNVSSYSETKLIFFTNSAVVVTSLVRSHVVFKLLNYVTDKIVKSSANNISAYVNVCKLPVREREQERWSMCFSYIIKFNFVAKAWIWSVVFILLFTIFICLASVIVGFGYFAVLGCKDIWNIANHLAKWYGHNAVPGTTFTVRFPENNCTP